jgi:hypothetical protein
MTRGRSTITVYSSIGLRRGTRLTVGGETRRVKRIGSDGTMIVLGRVWWWHRLGSWVEWRYRRVCDWWLYTWDGLLDRWDDWRADGSGRD